MNGNHAFASLAPQPADALLGLIGLFQADPRGTKIDLGVGVYRDDTGKTPIMRAVKAAEAVLLESQTTKAYLGADGDPVFIERLTEILFAETQRQPDRLTGIQTPGGSGALRLGAELLALSNPAATVWIGEPSWANHAPIFSAAGLQVQPHRSYYPHSATLVFDAIISDLQHARPGDGILLQGSCHNPTGATFTTSQWEAIADLCERRGLLPFVDLAYQGLGDGLDEDVHATREIFASVPSALLAYSCDKNFGLYRERVGGLWVQSPNAASTTIIRSNLLALARCLWSMPPDHGAAVVRTILEQDELRTDWLNELTEMRERINGLRHAIAAACAPLSFIGEQRGMFAMLPISNEAVSALRNEEGIYMAGNGRINIAGLHPNDIDPFVSAVTPHLQSIQRTESAL